MVVALVIFEEDNTRFIVDRPGTPSYDTLFETEGVMGTDEIIAKLKELNVDTIAGTPENGATGLYGDLNPGRHTIMEFEEWLRLVGGD